MPSQFCPHKKKIQKILPIMTINLEGNCNLHNWFQSSGSSLMVVPVKINKGLGSLVSTISSMKQPLSFVNQISPRFGMRPYELVSNTNQNLLNSLINSESFSEFHLKASFTITYAITCREPKHFCQTSLCLWGYPIKQEPYIHTHTLGCL